MSHFNDLIESCIREDSVREECVLSRYETIPRDILAMKTHLERHGHAEWIPVYWEIDVADENNGWFPGFALHFCNSPPLLHIAVPKEHGGSYDGEVQLDWRIVRLRRCIQESTTALFKQIVRDSVFSIKWAVDFLDSRDTLPITLTEDNCIDISSPKDTHGKAKWGQTIARFYISMVNVLLVEDHSKSPSTYMSDNDYILLAPNRYNLRLRYCHRLKGLSVFETLVFDEGIRCTPQAREQIKQAAIGGVRQDEVKVIRKPPQRKPPPKPAESFCVVCLSMPVSSVAFVPCGHQVMCLPCLQGSTKRKDLLCPLCRQVIKQRITIYRP